MSRGRIIAGVGLLVLAGLVVLFSYYLGGEAKHSYEVLFRDNATWAASAGLDCERISYDRGIFSSLAETRISPQGEQKPAFVLHHNISHGPFLPRGESLLGLALIETRGELISGNRTGILDNAFRNKNPLQASTHVALGGDVRARITSPEDSWQAGESKMIWGGMNGTVHIYQGAAREGELDFRLPRMEIEVPGLTGDVVVKGVHLRRRVAWNPRGGIKNGTARLDCAEVSAPGAKWGDFRLESISSSSRTQLQQGLYESKSKMGFDKGRLGDTRFSDGEFSLRLDNLSAQAMRRMQRGLQTNGQMSRKETRAVLRSFLATSPRLEQARLSLETGEGGVSAKAAASFNGTGELNLDSRQLVKRIRGGASILVPEPMGMRMARIPARFMLSVFSEREPESEQVDQRARKMLQRLRKKGYIEKEAGSYSTSLHLQRGRVTLGESYLLHLQDLFSGN